MKGAQGRIGALALALSLGLAGCHDFQEAYDDCVARGICAAGDGPKVLGAVDPAVSTISIDRPDGVVANGTDAAQVTITLRDKDGNPLPGLEVVLSASGGSNTLTPPPATDGAGSAVGKLASTVAESKTLTATVQLTTGPVVLAAHPTVKFAAGPATALAFKVEPADGSVAAPFDPPLEVGVVDAHGNVVKTASSSITLTLGSGPSGAALEGTAVTTAVNGIATFAGLFATKPGSGYSLVALSTGLTPATSRAFTRSPADPNASASSVTVSPSTVPADDVATATITVVVRNLQGSPLRGQGVSFAVSGAGNTVVAQALQTNDLGTVTATVRSSEAGAKTVTVTVDPGGTLVVLSQRPTITFTPAAPAITLQSADAISGCIPLQYTLSQRQGLPVDLTVEYDLTGSGTFVRATQAGSLAAGLVGVTAVPTTNAAQGRTFLWNSSADLPGRSLTGVRVRITASVQGVASAPSTRSNVLVSNGVSFGNGVDSAVVPNTTEVATGDVNLDGKVDAVVLGGSSFSVVLGGGDGGVLVTGPVNAGTSTLGGLSLGDFNQDGKLDVAFGVTLTKTAGLSLGAGDGGFAAPTFTALGFAPTTAAAGDFNRDGRLDLVVNDPDAPGFAVILNNGSGFAAPTVFTRAGAADSFAVGDLNRDGKLDLVWARTALSTLVVELGDGAGGFPGTPQTTVLTSGALNARLGDFNQDGILDVAVQTQTDVRVFLGLGTGALGAPRTIGTDTNTRGLTLGDFNGDGKLDALVARASTTSGLLLVGDGTGTLATGVTFISPSGPVATGAGDFTGDGLPDALLVSSSNLSLRPNQQAPRCDPLLSGAALSPANFEAPAGLTVGDFNQDGKPDLAIADRIGGRVSVSFGRGNGAFGAPVNYSTGSFCYDVRAADLDGDQRLDLITSNASANSISVLLGSVNGTFQPAVNYPVAGWTEALRIADLDHDGALDVVAVSENAPGSINVLRGLGNGSLAANVRYDAGSTGTTRLDLIDADGDGWLDVAATSTTDVTLIRGADGGTFLPPQRLLLTDNPSGVAAGDLDQDGIPDLAITHKIDGGVDVLAGNGDGTFGSAGRRATSAGRAAGAPASFNIGSFAPVLADLDRDGRLDLTVAHSNNATVGVLRGQASGDLGPFSEYLAGARGPNALDYADFDGDGRLDLATADVLSGLTVTSGNGDGSFRTAASQRLPVQPVAMVVADLDRDGAPDVAALSADALFILHGNGDGSLQPPVRFDASTGRGPPVGANAQDLVAVDLNRDGWLDLVSANRDVPGVAVMLADGAGGFAATTNLTLTAGAYKLVPGDFDRDGRPDLVAVISSAGSSLVFLKGNGSGGLAVGTPLSIATFPSGMASADFNNDGKLDVAVSDLFTSRLVVFLNSGTGVFTAQPQITGFTMGRLSTGDLNQDGRADLAMTVGSDSTNTRVLTGKGDGTFDIGSAFDVGASGRALAIGDLNGDGHPDLVIGGSTDAVANIAWGDGRGAFSFQTGLGMSGAVVALQVLDMDRDGRQDLVALTDDWMVMVLRARR